MQRSLKSHVLWAVVPLLIGVNGMVCVSVAKEESQTTRPKDAAEAVGEGNVQQWIEYYQRTRPPTPPIVSKPDDAKPIQPSPNTQQAPTPAKP